MHRQISAACAALALSLTPFAGHAAASAETTGDRPLASLFVDFFQTWKSNPQNLTVSDLKVLKAGGELRVLCGAYDLPGQATRPFLVLGDDKPSASAAWEPGSFPESDPLYPQLMDNLRLCQRLGVEVSLQEAPPTRAPKV